MTVPAGPPLTSDKPTFSGPKSVVEVEESRTQRLQRQQARFRDRGGIFVPTNRNTLVDILLGKVAAGRSPKKVRSRSTSISPQKSKGKRLETVKKDVAKGAEVEEDTPLRRTSPRKQARKEKLGSADIQPVAGPSLPADSGSKLSIEPKPARVKLKAKLKFSEKTSNPEKKRRGRPPKEKPVSIFGNDDEPEQGDTQEVDGKAERKAQNTTRAKAKAPSKPSTKSKSTASSSEAAARQDSTDDVRNPSNSEVHTNEKEKSKEIILEEDPPVKPKRGRKKMLPAADIPEESILSSTKRRLKRSTKPAKIYTELSDIDEVTEPSTSKLSGSKMKSSATPTSAKETSTAADELIKESEMITKGKGKATVVPPIVPKKRTRELDPLDNGETKKPKVEPPPMRKRPKANNKSQDDVDEGVSLRVTKATTTVERRSKAYTNKTRVIDDPEPPSACEGGPLVPEASSKKRAWVVEEDDAAVGDTTSKPQKRSKNTVEVDDPPAKKTRKAPSKPTKKAAGTNALEAPVDMESSAKRKTKDSSSTAEPPAKKVPAKSSKRPPASVLKIVKKPRPTVIDEERDEIDFLS